MSDHNSMLYWYPKIVGKVPTPKTVIVTRKALIKLGFLEATSPTKRSEGDK